MSLNLTTHKLYRLAVKGWELGYNKNKTKRKLKCLVLLKLYFLLSYRHPAQPPPTSLYPLSKHLKLYQDLLNRTEMSFLLNTSLPTTSMQSSLSLPSSFSPLLQSSYPYLLLPTTEGPSLYQAPILDLQTGHGHSFLHCQVILW